MSLNKLLFFMLALASCHKQKDKPATSAPQTNLAKVMTEKTQAKPLFDSILYPAKVEAASQASVLSETDGLISSVKVTLGRPIRKGDLLLTIDNPDPVYKFSPVAVVSPVDGVVSFLEASVGNRVERGRKLAVISDIQALKIVLEVTSSDLKSIKVGQSGDFMMPSSKVTAKIHSISPVIDPLTGTATVELKPLKNEGLMPGMLGRVEFRVNERQGINVLDNALVYRGSDPYLRVLDAQTVHWKKVTIGQSANGLTEVLSGIKSGDQIIVRASAFIADGDKVEIQASRKDEVAIP